MQDTSYKGDGTSRSLKIPASKAVVYQTVQDMVQDMVNGDFLLDIGPIRLDGVNQKGTDLNKSSLLTDKTETNIWGSAANRTVDEALAKLRDLITSAQNSASNANTNANGRARFITGSYKGTNSNSKSVYVGAKPKVFMVMSELGMMFHVGSSSERSHCGMIAMDGVNYAFSSDTGRLSLNWGSTMSWSYDVDYENESSWSPALNYASRTYKWLAIV